MNVFEKIIRGEIPCDKVLESELYLAFKDINPKAPVHILVIPKSSVKDFESADCALLGGISDFIKEVTKKTGLDKSGYRIITNIGEHGGQEVPHLHFHILGGAKLKWENLA